jgi:hypothetical protein
MVNTFVLTTTSFDPDFSKNAVMLDKRRLGKQRVEALQILNILNDIEYISKTLCGIEPPSQVTLDENKLSARARAEKFKERCDWVKTIRTRYHASQVRYFCTDKVYTTEKGARKVSTGFWSHPVVRMWVGYTKALEAYINACIYEWTRRGYKNTMDVYPSSEYCQPWWRESQLSPVLISHICSLKRKEPMSYENLTLPSILDEWNEYGYSWVPNLSVDILEKLFQNLYLHPSLTTVAVTK